LQGIEGFAEVVIAPNMVEGTWRRVFPVVVGMLGYADVPNVCKKGSEVSSSFGIAFYSVPDVTLKFLRIFFMPASFFGHFCVLLKAV